MSKIIHRVHRMPVYSGHVRRQVGGSVFGFLKRMVQPVFEKAKPHLKEFGKKALGAAVRVGSHALKDVVSGNFSNIPDTLKRESKNSANEISEDYIGTKLFQEGAGMYKRKRLRKLDLAKKIKKRRQRKLSSTINKMRKQKKKIKKNYRDIFTK